MARNVLLGMAPVTASQRMTDNDLGNANFERLRVALRPHPVEAWRQIPWQISIWTALSIADRERKPVVMVMRSGHPLGCT